MLGPQILHSVQDDAIGYVFCDPEASRCLLWFDETDPHRFVDSLQAGIAAEIPRHVERWGGQTVPDPEEWIEPTFASVEEWEENVEVMRTFAEERPWHAARHVLAHFGLEGTAQVTLRAGTPGAGHLQVEGRRVAGPEHAGTYFRDVPLDVEAVPVAGYRFSHWTVDGAERTTQALEITPRADVTATAHFEPDDGAADFVVINEINYNSSDDFDADDWVELYNRRDQAVDLGGWVLQDEEDEHRYVFPEGTVVDAYGYLVVSANKNV